MENIETKLGALGDLLTNHWAPGFRAKRTAWERDGTLPAGNGSLEEWVRLWNSISPLGDLAEFFRIGVAVGVALLSDASDDVEGKLHDLVGAANWPEPSATKLCELACRTRAMHDVLDRMKGSSEAMRKVREETWAAAFGKNLAQTVLSEHLLRSTPVLICGETGTGKELVATALAYSVPGRWDHRKGEWTAPGFEASHLAALPDTLVNDELFGHMKGAFTGADSDRPGVFERCSEGVVFLDEVGELPGATQIALLRVLQEKKIRRLGSKKDISASPRVISATNRDVDAMIEDKRFREDLIHRLSSVVVEVPPLRERTEDIQELVEHEVKQLGGTASQLFAEDMRAEVEKRAVGYDWPGNVRELTAVVRSVAIGMEPRLRSCKNREAEVVPSGLERGDWTLQRVQRWYATKVRDSAHSDVDAARRLGIHRQTLRRYLEEPQQGDAS